MMTFSDETLMAYVDGELDDATRTAVDSAMTTDAELAQRVARHRELRARLHREFDAVLKEPIPEQLLAAAKGKSAKPHTAKVVALTRIRAGHWAWPQWGALAASLVVGVLIAPLLRHEPTAGPLDVREGEVLASGALARALSEQLASNQTAAAPVHVGVSFLSRDGDYCRTFVFRAKNAVAGLACRDGESWRLRVLEATRPTSGSGEYQPAASGLPSAVERSIEELIVGDPLDAKAEAAASRNAWHHTKK